MKSIVLVFLALSVLAVANAVRDPDQQKLLNYWSQELIGKELVSGTSDNFNSETQFKEEDLPSPYRVLRKGQITTMEFRRDRLNILINDSNVITKIYYA